uniref:Uncharacterized protein n=1 Tax=Arundo donax TaxID=35708 RepID=A0A0A9C8L8_ARUDO
MEMRQMFKEIRSPIGLESTHKDMWHQGVPL